jgi:hypothetical protein
MQQLNKQEIIEAIRFYGSVASTNGIDEGIKKLANKNISRLIGALEPETDRILAEASGITL